ncbi:MAG TPA: hypothetical protein VJP41_11765 [Gaiellaceae bacterium]|nr:hypothetical protein [Gaiellaceae bacterium]
MRLLIALATATTVSVWGAAGWHVWHARGLAVRLPPRWHATATALTPVGYPQLAIASYPLPRGDRGADGCEPRSALDRLPADGVFIFAWEFPGTKPGKGFPRQPRHFRLTHFARYECLGPSYLLRFQAAGRYFQVHVVFGKRATLRTRRLALRTLDSLVVHRR